MYSRVQKLPRVRCGSCSKKTKWLKWLEFWIVNREVRGSNPDRVNIFCVQTFGIELPSLNRRSFCSMFLKPRLQIFLKKRVKLVRRESQVSAGKSFPWLGFLRVN